MTREEAIEFGNLWLQINEDSKDSNTYEFFRMAIKALEQEDCISRQAVEKIINKWLSHSDYELKDSIYDMTKKIHKLPSVTSQPKIGRWITKDGKEQGYDISGVKTWYIQIMCSECGFIETAIEGHTGQYHYCHNCGVKMQEVEE